MVVPKRFPLSGFKWVENMSQVYQNFIKGYNEEKEEYFLEVDFQYTKKFHDSPFLSKRIKIEKLKN